MNKILQLIFLLLASIVSAEEEQRSITIGAIASLTGGASEQGKSWLNGVKLAVKHLKENEAINVTLVVEDDKTLPVQATSAFEKLVAANQVQGIIGGTWDFLAEALSPLALKHKIPLITPSNPVEILSDTTRKNPYFFTNGLSIAATEEAIEKAILPLNIKTLAIVVPNVPFGLAHAEAIERIASRLNIKIVYRSDFELSGYQESLRTSALKLSIKKPDLIFIHTEYASLFSMVKELHQRKFSPWIVTSQHLSEAVKLSGSSIYWQKTIGISPISESKKFIDDFTNEYKEPPRVFASEGYDAAIFLARTLSKGVDLSMNSFETQGLQGVIKSVPGKTEIFHYQAKAFKVSENGELGTL